MRTKQIYDQITKGNDLLHMILKSPASSDYNSKLGVEGDSDLGFPALYGEA